MSLRQYERMVDSINSYNSINLLMDQYYEGTQAVPKLNIALPPIMNAISIVVGWPTTTVDVLHERTDWRGWDPEDAKLKGLLDEAWDDNQLEYESSLGHLDSLLYGTSFAAVHTGDTKAGEPKWLVTIESAKHMTGTYNRRKRRLDMAASKGYNAKGEWVYGTLYEENRTTKYERLNELSPWVVVDVDQHNLGRVPVVRLINRGRAGRREGKSEITRAVRSYTNMCVRTLLGMEVNREFFSAPQRYALGAKENAFVDRQGNLIPGWKAIMGSLWNMQRDEEWVEEHGGEGLPQVGQFPANPPGPYIEQIKGLSQMFASEVGIPVSYLGFATENPPSADSIRALEARLVKRAERRISAWNPAWVEVAQLIAYFETKEIPKMREVPTIWQNPATPTSAADADRAVKLVGAQILPAESSVTAELVGLTPSQIRRVERDRNTMTIRDLLKDTGNGDQPGNVSNQPEQNQPAGTGTPATNAPAQQSA